MIKEGYKRTDLGIIPESWEIKELSKITSLITNGFVGKATDHYTTSEDGVLYIQGYNVDGFEFNFNGIKYVTKEFHLKNKKSILKKGDLLTIQTGDVGLTAYVPKELEGSNCHALIITRYIKDKAHSKFYHQYFNSIIGRYRLSRIETGSTMKHINCGDLKKLLIPIPPLPEQQAIANCLTTWDSGIEKLTQLIAAKREQKKGLMQQLLTGKKRLDGFVGEWKEVKLGDIAIIYQPRTISQNVLTENGYYVYGANGIIGYYSEYNHETEQIAVVCRGSTCGLVNLTKPKSWITGNAMVINVDDNDNVSKSFLFEYLTSDNLKYLITGSGQPQITSDIKKHKVKLPSIEEQKTITKILEKANQEISLLEAKLAAMKEEKKGLMQVLLTGKKRLIDS